MKLQAFPLLVMLATLPLNASDAAPGKPAASGAREEPVLYWPQLKQTGEKKRPSMPDLPKDGFEKVEDLRKFYGQKIEGLAGSCGGVEEIAVGNRHYWLCSRFFGSGEVAQEYAVFCERNGRLEASLVIPFLLELIVERHDSKILVSTHDSSSKRRTELSFLDLALLELK